MDKNNFVENKVKYLVFVMVILLTMSPLKAQDWQTLMRHEATTSLEQALINGDKTQFLHIKKTTLTQAQLQSIGKLKNLKVLKLNKTAIKTLGDWLYQLENLQILDLSFNNLTTLNADFSKLEKLQYLSLYGNQFEILPLVITKLKRLKAIYLGKNIKLDVAQSIKSIVANKQLTHLGLGGLQMRELPASITSLKTLQELFLGGNKLGALPAGFDQLTNLKLLTLNNNFFTDVPSAIRKMQGLEKVMLKGNALVAIIPKGKYSFEVAW
jgi:Leucine-rich repeat (LRR) protein